MKTTINALFQAESCLRLLRDTRLGVGREVECMSRIEAALDIIAAAKQDLMEVENVGDNDAVVESRRIRGCHRR